MAIVAASISRHLQILYVTEALPLDMKNHDCNENKDLQKVVSVHYFDKFEALRKIVGDNCPIQVNSFKDDRLIPHLVKTVTCTKCSRICAPVKLRIPYLQKQEGSNYKLILKETTVAYYVRNVNDSSKK